MLQPGIVRKRLAAGIDRVDRQIGGGDFVAGQILGLAKLLIGKAPKIDEAGIILMRSRVAEIDENDKRDRCHSL